MKILVTGHEGYVGSVLAPLIRGAGHEVVGLDTGWYEGCDFGPPTPKPPRSRSDIRNVDWQALQGCDAVIHLAAICNDPLGNLNPASTYDINHHASVRLAEAAKRAGVRRWLFASSCSLYGRAGNEMLTEEADFSPMTPYGESKILVERDVRELASNDFSPVFLRNATAYGISPRLRGDIVVNNLVGHAVTTGEIVVESDGTPWRPLVHVEDIGRAFLAAVEAPREAVHNQAFNVGRNDDNLRVSEIVAMVQEAIPECRVRFAEGGGPDTRSYRVDCSKIRRHLPQFAPTWTVRTGIIQLRDAYLKAGMDHSAFFSDRYFRVKRISRLQVEGRLDQSLRWTAK